MELAHGHPILSSIFRSHCFAGRRRPRAATPPLKTAASFASSKRSPPPASTAQPAIYDESFADAVREQLLAVDGVLVWVDPIHQGKTRAELDAAARRRGARPWVSAHPDVILKMGVKEVLYRTRDLGWGADTHRYDSAAAFAAEFPQRLRAGGRACSSRIAATAARACGRSRRCRNAIPTVRVLHALRGSHPEDMPLDAFIARCEPYFGWGGCIIDQPFQPRLPDGMIRCYMSGAKVAGFGHQLIKALIPPPPQGPESPEAQPGPRIMHGPDAPQFQALRRRMEDEWTPQMMKLLAIDEASMPVIWDADFLFGPATRPAPTPTFSVRSMRARVSRSPMRRRQRSHGRCASGWWARSRSCGGGRR